MSLQEIIDSFYAPHGPCCAGCDWWHHVNSLVGECHRSAPVPGEQRIAMLGMHSISIAVPAGHVMTPREHHCGEFTDAFDWSSLPANYLRRIGRTIQPQQTGSPPALEVRHENQPGITMNQITPIYTDANGQRIFHIIDKKPEPLFKPGTVYTNNLPNGVDQHIQFQNGNPATEGVNGFTNEALLAVLIHRTTILDLMYPCVENAAAIANMRAALAAFELRTAKRIARGVEGTMTA